MIFITGGASYIGFHTVVELLNAWDEVTVFHNFYNSQPDMLTRMVRITGKQPKLVQGDIRGAAALTQALHASSSTAVIHFTGLKAVGESMQKPLDYYDNNIVGATRLLQAMTNCKVKALVFSSSATVYGDPQYLPAHRSPSAVHNQPLWPDQTGDLRHAARPASQRPEWATQYRALFQSYGGACQRADCRGPAWHAQQPADLCGPGGGGATRVFECVGQSSPHSRSHRCVRLHPCSGPGAGAPEGAGTFAGPCGVPSHYLGDCDGLQRA